MLDMSLQGIGLKKKKKVVGLSEWLLEQFVLYHVMQNFNLKINTPIKK